MRAMLLLACGATLVLAQAPPSQPPAARAIALPPATGTLAEAFTAIAAVRELPDGRVLVADDKDDRVIVADFRSHTIAAVGRRGAGPGEYRDARTLFAMAGDTTLLVDLMAGRWIFLSGTAAVRTTPPDAALVREHRGGVLGTDARGGVWRADLPFINRTIAVQEVADSGVLIRTNIATGVADTLARLRLTPRRAVVTNGGAGLTLSTGALPEDEQAVPFPDGAFAVVRLQPYRLERYGASGAKEAVFALPDAHQPITSRERAAFLKRAGNPLAALDAYRGAPPAVLESIPRAYSEFPREYPPIVLAGVLSSPGGTVVIRKPETADHPNARYDVVDRRTGYRGTIELPARTRIVGFGARAVYVASADADGIERLRRHRWPP